ncbi:MAG: DUF2523 domain-containing protein [Xanthomonadaceae bacterium]|jgi:hypothetical protein|nr:DUF2523 domain-containing protein [Xanthomonadaceae bacterium]
MPAIIAALVAAIINAARHYLPGILGRCMLALGIGFFVHEIGFPALKSFLQSYVSGLPSVLISYFDASGIGAAVTMIISAIVAVRSQRLILSKLSS